LLNLTAALFTSGGGKIRKVKNALQHRTAVSLLSIFTTCIVIFLMTGALYFRNEVTITDDGNTYKIFTTQTTAEDILREQGLSLTGLDYYSFNEGTGTGRANMSLEITRSHGETETATNDIRPLGRIELSEKEVISVNLSSVAYLGIEAAVSVTSYAERVEINSIPFDTISEPSNHVAIGTTKVVVEGVEGIERVSVVDTIKDGEVIATEIITREVLSQPVTEELQTGLAFSEPYSKREFPEIELVDGVPVNYEFMLSGKSTAYTAGPTCQTASGRPLVVGSVAVDPKKIPYGSLVYIVTQCGEIVYGAAVASDTGGFIHNTDVIVDVYMGLTDDNLTHAINWGLRQVDVYVISTGIY